MGWRAGSVAPRCAQSSSHTPLSYPHFIPPPSLPRHHHPMHHPLHPPPTNIYTNYPAPTPCTTPCTHLVVILEAGRHAAQQHARIRAQALRMEQGGRVAASRSRALQQHTRAARARRGAPLKQSKRRAQALPRGQRPPFDTSKQHTWKYAVSVLLRQTSTTAGTQPARAGGGGGGRGGMEAGGACATCREAGRWAVALLSSRLPPTAAGWVLADSPFSTSSMARFTKRHSTCAAGGAAGRRGSGTRALARARANASLTQLFYSQQRAGLYSPAPDSLG